MIVRMESLNLADVFVTFLALLGPQKVLLSFARLGRALDVQSMRRVAGACGTGRQHPAGARRSLNQMTVLMDNSNSQP
jgi:hypothetical protein